MIKLITLEIGEKVRLLRESMFFPTHYKYEYEAIRDTGTKDIQGWPIWLMKKIDLKNHLELEEQEWSLSHFFLLKYVINKPLKSL